MSRKKAYVMGAYNERKPSHVKPYQHPHFQGIFQRRQKYWYQHYQERKWNTQIFMEQGISKPLFNRTLSESKNYYKIEKLQQQ
jgi:hypothetical protein